MGAAHQRPPYIFTIEREGHMTLRVSLIFTSLLIVLILSIAIERAPANRLELNSQTFRATWTSLRLANNINANTMACPVTLEGSLHSATIAKTVGALIGYLTKASLSNSGCTGGSATIAQESLPWHIRYRGFAGTLPDITSITLGLVGARFIIRETGGLQCNGTTSATNPAVGSVTMTGRVAEALVPDSNDRIPLEGGLCGLGGQGTFTGTSQTLTQLGSTARIEVALIGGVPGSLEPSPVAFGTLEPSQLSVRTVTITARSEGFTVNRISVERGNYFAITDPNNCVGARLGERARCSFKTVFVAPAEAGRRPTDKVFVETTGERLEDTIEGST